MEDIDRRTNARVQCAIATESPLQPYSLAEYVRLVERRLRFRDTLISLLLLVCVAEAFALAL